MAKKPRIPVVAREAATDEQRRVGDFIFKKRNEIHAGPSATMLHIPQLAERFELMREHILAAGLPADLMQLMTLVVARYWGVDYVWNVRVDLSRKAGINESIIDAIRDRRTPKFSDPRQEAIYTYAMELMSPSGPSDAAHEAALKVLGRVELLIEIVAVAGLYSFLALQGRAADLAIQPGATPLLK